ncbi:MAG: cell division ATP-binding protein FtsE [Cycloclasticus sp. symbiont of Poecilosclerida sp. M]|nr:MAG: cell division ATP-binding protein FtsE [Cycloclasticus sp. symbiont of Poecilosclerida sp. M]
MLQFNNVSKRYTGGKDALRNINFELGRGEMAFLTGHSGAGKSTLLKLIALLERPTQGQVLLDNQNISRIAKRHIPFARRKIGMIFQDHRLLHDRTVYDNVSLPLIVAGFRHQDISRRVRAALDKVGLLGKEQRYPISLSGGEQQRVGIARAIVSKPPMLLADEPTGNLDPRLSEEIMGLFEQFNQVGVTVLIASHDISLINRLGYRTLVLSGGQLPQEHDYHG